MRIIDAHIHLGLPEFCIAEKCDFQYDLCCTYDEVISLMNLHNISQAIVLPIPHYQFDSRKTNSYILEAFQHYPDRLIPFCRIDEDLEENLYSNGFRGVKLHLVYEDIDIKKNKKNFQLIEDANVPLLIHAKFKNKVQQVEEILKYAPNLTVILAHMGRGHIYTSEQIVENAMELKKYPNVYMDLSTVGDIKGIANCVDILGDDRVLFGSDFPFGKNYLGDAYNYADDISLINKTFTADQVEKILHQNIEDILSHAEKDHLHIRRAKKTDVDSILTLLDALDDQDKKFLALQNKRSLIRQVIRSESHCYLALINEKIVGFMRESGRPQNYSLLEEIVVNPDYRGKGIAREMLKYYHNAFPKNMAKTNANNETMIHLFKENDYVAENPKAQRIINWIRNGE